MAEHVIIFPESVSKASCNVVFITMPSINCLPFQFHQFSLLSFILPPLHFPTFWGGAATACVLNTLFLYSFSACRFRNRDHLACLTFLHFIPTYCERKGFRPTLRKPVRPKMPPRIVQVGPEHKESKSLACRRRVSERIWCPRRHPKRRRPNFFNCFDRFWHPAALVIMISNEFGIDFMCEFA